MSHLRCSNCCINYCLPYFRTYGAYNILENTTPPNIYMPEGVFIYIYSKDHVNLNSKTTSYLHQHFR